MKKILIALILCIGFYACDNGEVERLQRENASLKEQIAELSETEQNRFSKAVDFLKTANDLQSYRMAEKNFDDFIEKFPASSYLESARQHKQQAKNKADNIEKVANTKTDITSLIAQRKWSAATNKVNSIKTLIDNDEYNALLKQIKEERYKPEKTTIKKLNAEAYTLIQNYWFNETSPNKLGKRVEIIGYLKYLEKIPKKITLFEKENAEYDDESIEIDYRKTNKVDYFSNISHAQANGRYKVIGRVRVKDDGVIIYIEGETIERI